MFDFSRTFRTVFLTFFYITTYFCQNIGIEGLFYNGINDYLKIAKNENQCLILNKEIYIKNSRTVKKDTPLIFDIKSNDSIQLEQLPVDKTSKIFVKTDTVLNLSKQDCVFDSSFKFEQITYHVSDCEGDCQAKHLRINAKGDVFLLRETADIFKKKPLKSGSFYAKLSTPELENLVRILKSSNLQSINSDNVDCCDFQTITLIVYFNGQKKYYKSTNPPPAMNSLINKLNEISENSIFLESHKKYIFER
jgi:hypothetical protein